MDELAVLQDDVEADAPEDDQEEVYYVRTNS